MPKATTYVVKGHTMSLGEFKKGASKYYPSLGKSLKNKHGETVARYSPKTKRVKVY